MLIDPVIVRDHLAVADDVARSTTERGRALETLIEHVFLTVPGVTHALRDRLNAFRSEELDLAFWNERDTHGFYFLPNIILLESKNWGHPAGSSDVDWFVSKMRRRGQELGIFLTLRGITGDPEQVTSARHIVASALQEGRKILVIDRQEILALRNSDDLVRLLQTKLMSLIVSGTSL